MIFVHANRYINEYTWIHARIEIRLWMNTRMRKGMNGRIAKITHLISEHVLGRWSPRVDRGARRTCLRGRKFRPMHSKRNTAGSDIRGLFQYTSIRNPYPWRTCSRRHSGYRLWPNSAGNLRTIKRTSHAIGNFYANFKRQRQRRHCRWYFGSPPVFATKSP